MSIEVIDFSTLKPILDKCLSSESLQPLYDWLNVDVKEKLFRASGGDFDSEFSEYVKAHPKITTLLDGQDNNLLHLIVKHYYPWEPLDTTLPTILDVYPKRPEAIEESDKNGSHMEYPSHPMLNQKNTEFMSPLQCSFFDTNEMGVIFFEALRKLGADIWEPWGDVPPYFLALGHHNAYSAYVNEFGEKIFKPVEVNGKKTDIFEYVVSKMRTENWNFPIATLSLHRDHRAARSSYVIGHIVADPVKYGELLFSEDYSYDMKEERTDEGYSENAQYIKCHALLQRCVTEAQAVQNYDQFKEGFKTFVANTPLFTVGRQSNDKHYMLINQLVETSLYAGRKSVDDGEQEPMISKESKDIAIVLLEGLREQKNVMKNPNSGLARFLQSAGGPNTATAFTEEYRRELNQAIDRLSARFESKKR